VLFKGLNVLIIELYDFCCSRVICISIFSYNVNCATCDVNPTYERKKNYASDDSTFNDTANDTDELVCKGLSLGNEEANN
jgi:hypothetical protein